MTCRSWWCGNGATIELGRVPPGTRAILPCGCIVTPAGGPGEIVPVTFEMVSCASHAERPAAIPPGTPVTIDVLSSLLQDR